MIPLGQFNQTVAATCICAAYPWRQFVSAGGLMSYGTSVTDLYRRDAGHAIKY
jgi:hypothetical protein